MPCGRSTHKSTTKSTGNSTNKSTTKNTTKSATKSATKYKSPAAPGVSLERTHPPPIYDSDSDSDFVSDTPQPRLVCRVDSDWDSDIVSDPESYPHPNRNSTSTANIDDSDYSDDSDFVDDWASSVDVLVTEAGTGSQ